MFYVILFKICLKTLTKTLTKVYLHENFFMYLSNGCTVSSVNIFPSNWNTKKADVNAIWYISYRFKDPCYLEKFPNGKQVMIKSGLNRITNLVVKQATIKKMRELTIEHLEKGYNPILKNVSDILQTTDDEPKILTEVLPSSPFIKALWYAHSISQLDRYTLKDCASAIRSIEKCAVEYDYHEIPILEVQAKHIRRCLDLCHTSNPKFSGRRYNRVKAHLSGLFRELIQLGAIDSNVTLLVNPMKETANKQIVLTDEEIEKVKTHLYTNYRSLYNFMMLFYYSGGRMKELFRMKGSDVDLGDQKYTTLVKKGKQEKWLDRTIRNVALPLWKEQMKNCKSDDYVFSKGLLPGPLQINSKQVTRRWSTHVMKPLDIKATFYKLKHLNTDRTLAAAGAKMAAGQNAHMSTKMVEQVYAYNEKKRMHEGLKTLDIKL